MFNFFKKKERELPPFTALNESEIKDEEPNKSEDTKSEEFLKCPKCPDGYLVILEKVEPVKVGFT